MGAAPLFDWPVMKELRRLRTERDALIERIAELPRNSHRRIALQERLKTLTAQILTLEIEHARGA